MGRGVCDDDSVDGGVLRRKEVDGMILVVLLRRDWGVGIVGVRQEITRKGSVTKNPESHGRRHKKN